MDINNIIEKYNLNSEKTHKFIRDAVSKKNLDLRFVLSLFNPGTSRIKLVESSLNSLKEDLRTIYEEAIQKVC